LLAGPCHLDGSLGPAQQIAQAFENVRLVIADQDSFHPIVSRLRALSRVRMASRAASSAPGAQAAMPTPCVSARRRSFLWISGHSTTIRMESCGLRGSSLSAA